MPKIANHLLIVGGGRSVPELAKKFNPDVTISVVCRPISVARFPDRSGFLRLVTIPESAPVQQWVDAANYVNSVKHIDAIVAINERDLVSAAAIGAELGLPAPAKNTVDAVNNKELMRSILRSAGVDRTPARSVTSAEDIAAFGKEVGYPIIIKPLMGVGSRGIARIDTEEEIRSSLDYSSSEVDSLQSETIMAEKFHTGTEYSVECITEDGRHLVTCITAKYSDPAHFVELGHVLPASVEPATEHEITATVTRALDSLGIRSGVTHTEVIATVDGTHIIETHIRPAGDRIPEMLSQARGVDLIGLLVKQALGFPILDETRELLESERGHDQYAAVWYACPSQRGRVSEIEGVSEAESAPGVSEVKLKTNVGDVLREVNSSDSRAAFVWALGDTREQALERAQAGAGMLKFLTAE